MINKIIVTGKKRFISLNETFIYIFSEKIHKEFVFFIEFPHKYKKKQLSYTGIVFKELKFFDEAFFENLPK